MQKKLIDKLLQASTLINLNAPKANYIEVNSNLIDMILNLRPENRISKIKKIFNEEVFIR
jgi:hypothetical protein